ncbi:MAG: M17 family peptidase N-terminal domain-containing protein [Nitrospirota bacterium]
MVLKVLMHDIKKLETEAVAVGFFEDIRPLKGVAGALDWILCGALTQLLMHNKIRGALGEAALLTTKGKIPAPKVFMVGLGPRSQMTPARLREASRVAATIIVGAGVTRAALDCFPLRNDQSEEYLTAVRQGLEKGAGHHALDIALLAPDAASFEAMSRSVRA